MTEIKEDLLNKALNQIINKKNVFSTVLCVESGDNSFSWTGAAGEMQKDSRYFIASVTKMYVTAVVMRLIEEERLQLDDPIAKYLPEDFIQGIHVLKGVEYSQDITIKHLISNTSGIPDYFFHKQSNGRTFADQILGGEDVAWQLEETITYSKQLTPKFLPGKKGKAAYSDTNYQLLGRIIENITGKYIGEVFQDYLFDELHLKHTYAYKDITDTKPVPFYYRSQKLWVPNYIASVTAEGGIVSTAEESMIFIKKFFNGHFFEKDKIESFKKWNLILPPPSLFFLWNRVRETICSKNCISI
ncbi:MAG: beta-lactamase family protein [Bacillaceae bacterium]|nr:beta-lactamase family protein [Bacillaceae bacterium]